MISDLLYDIGDLQYDIGPPIYYAIYKYNVLLLYTLVPRLRSMGHGEYKPAGWITVS